MRPNRKHQMSAVLLASALLWVVVGCTGIPPTGDGNTNGNANVNTNDNGDQEPAGFSGADAARGGALYDKWWVVASTDAPTEDHPLWAARPDKDSNTRTGSWVGPRLNRPDPRREHRQCHHALPAGVNEPRARYRVESKQARPPRSHSASFFRTSRSSRMTRSAMSICAANSRS